MDATPASTQLNQHALTTRSLLHNAKSPHPRQAHMVPPTRGRTKTSKHYLEAARRNAATVVDDLEPLLPVLLEGDLDAGGAGVEAVLDELLDGGGEVEDHLAGAYPVDGALVDGPDGGRRRSPRRLRLHRRGGGGGEALITRTPESHVSPSEAG